MIWVWGACTFIVRLLISLFYKRQKLEGKEECSGYVPRWYDHQEPSTIASQTAGTEVATCVCRARPKMWAHKNSRRAFEGSPKSEFGSSFDIRLKWFWFWFWFNYAVQAQFPPNSTCCMWQVWRLLHLTDCRLRPIKDVRLHHI